ncbi:MAG TPA: sigma factor [Ktedonobacteraceae bacterium]|jgi:DNA-directed RNA polymerase specialized sigma24 family protein
MMLNKPPESFEFGDDVDAFLLQLDPLIVTLVRRIASSPLFYDGEREDLVQRVRVKLAAALPGRKIYNLSGYLRRCVSNEVINFLRQQKPFSPLSLTSDGEILTGTILLSIGEGMADPIRVLEQRVAFEELLERVVEGVLLLPAVQKQAMLCLLCERVDDFASLFAAFKRRNIDLSRVCWPEDKFVRQRLRASCRPAVYNLARYLAVDMSPFKRRR